jgi:hypothetical protein
MGSDCSRLIHVLQASAGIKYSRVFRSPPSAVLTTECTAVPNRDVPVVFILGILRPGRELINKLRTHCYADIRYAFKFTFPVNLSDRSSLKSREARRNSILFTKEGLYVIKKAMTSNGEKVFADKTWSK